MTFYELKYKIHRTDYGYGIKIYNNDELIKTVDSFTENETDAIKLADLCSKLKIELCHIDDIIEDYLTDFCI